MKNKFIQIELAFKMSTRCDTTIESALIAQIITHVPISTRQLNIFMLCSVLCLTININTIKQKRKKALFTRLKNFPLRLFDSLLIRLKVLSQLQPARKKTQRKGKKYVNSSVLVRRAFCYVHTQKTTLTFHSWLPHSQPDPNYAQFFPSSFVFGCVRTEPRMEIAGGKEQKSEDIVLSTLSAEIFHHIWFDG